jgi:hypothetical protein
MSIEERDDLNPEEDSGLRRESEDVEGHGNKVRESQTRVTEDGKDADADDDVEAHGGKKVL